MTVGDLKAVLADQPDDRLVIMSKDGEGNEFSPLEDTGEGLYTARTTWSGDLCNLDEERQDGAVHVLTLWPTN